MVLKHLASPLPPAARTPSTGTPRRMASEALFGPTREVIIVHAGREYRLRITQNGKLILTA